MKIIYPDDVPAEVIALKPWLRNKKKNETYNGKKKKQKKTTRCRRREFWRAFWVI